MIVRSRIVVPVEGEPIDNGAVAIAGDKVSDVGRFKELKTQHGGAVVDLGEKVLLPGLINAHCHLDYTMLRGKIPPQQTFADWIRAINAEKATLTENDYLTAIEQGLAEAQRFGTTSLINLEAFPGLITRLPPPRLRVWWCAEMIDVRTPVPIQEISDDLGRWFDSNPKNLGGIGLSPHALYTASSQLFSKSSAIAREHDWLLTTHLAESSEERQMFCDAGGPLFELLRSLGRDMRDCGGVTPISALIGPQEIDQRWIVAHLNEISQDDFALLEHNNKFHVAHCPGSHAYFRHGAFALRRLQNLGFNVCLGTDSLASNSSLSLFSEMRGLIDGELLLSPREALTMATANGAHAIGQQDALGKIMAGFRADLIAIPYAGTERKVLDAIVGFEETVDWMMINGEVLAPD